MRVIDRIKLAFQPKNALLELLQRYADDYLTGKDVPTVTTIGKLTADSAMKYSAVFACNRVLAETVASCPVFLYEKTKEGRQTAVSHPLYERLHYQPNPDMTPSAFKESTVTNINFGGNSFYQKVIGPYGDLLELRPITWDRVRMKRDGPGSPILYSVDRSDRWQTRETILHIPGLTLDGYFGITPLEYAQTTLAVGITQETFQKRFYENGVMTSGIFEYPDELKEAAFKRLKEDIKTNYAGLANAGVPMILEGGGKFKEVSMKLSDAQFIESKRFQIEDICRFYRVPLHLVQDLSRSTNNNIETQSLEFVMYTMLPWFKRLEENLNLQLLGSDDRKAGRYFEFKVDALLRGDSKTRSEAYAYGRQWGWLSVNDIRRMENLNPIPNGDRYLEPVNMVEAGSDPVQTEESRAKLAQQIKTMLERGEAE